MLARVGDEHMGRFVRIEELNRVGSGYAVPAVGSRSSLTAGDPRH